MEYTVVIRTLGTAGEKYQQTLDSLCKQTISPKEILIYLAEGYSIPKETCGREKYIYVKKGMVAQRALPYEEANTEYILFLDDDVYLPPNGVESLFTEIQKHGADVISPNTFENHRQGLKTRLLNVILGKSYPFTSDKYVYRIALSGGYMYNNNPTKDFYWSESNAGPCFLMKKEDFLNIHFEEELWLDEAPYALPEDQVMFYKMHLKGLKIGTLFNSGIIHLDAGSTVQQNPDRVNRVLYSEVRNQIIFWHRFIKPNVKGVKSVIARLMISHYKNMRRLLALKSKLRGDDAQWNVVNDAIKNANEFVNNI